MELINQQSAAPTRKVTAAVLGALTGQIVAQIGLGYLPDTVQLAPLTEFAEMIFIGLFTAVSGYLTRERAA